MLNVFVRAAVRALLLLLCVSGMAFAADRVDIQVPEQVGRGKPFLMRIGAWYPMENLRVEWNGKTVTPTVTLQRDRSDAALLLGVGLRQDLGDYALKATVDIWGHEYVFTRVIHVVPSVWGHETLTVAPSKARPPKTVQDRLKREHEQVMSVLNRVTAERYWEAPFVRPVKGKMLSRFGLYRIFNGHTKARHTGLDFRAWKGTPEHAIAAGRVVLTGNFYFAGNAVYIDHGNGLITLSAHMSKILVKEGDMVKAGQTIGLSGATGRVTGAHLHLGVFVLGRVVDPEILFKTGEGNLFK